MTLRGERLHAWLHGFGWKRDSAQARAVFAETKQLFVSCGIATTAERENHILALAEHVYEHGTRVAETFAPEQIVAIVRAIMDYEGLFVLEEPDWSERRTTSQYWQLRDELVIQRDLAKNFDANCQCLANTLVYLFATVAAETPALHRSGSETDITVTAPKLDVFSALPEMLEELLEGPFDQDNVERGLFARIRTRLDRNLIIASGGNPDSGEAFKRSFVMPSKSGIADRKELLATYFGGTPLTQFFDGEVAVTIPQQTRFEHHHIVAGSGHGKTQTLQYLIAHDLEQAARHRASVVVIDSQGDLIRTIQRLKLVNEDNLVLIDPTDVAFPVCLNLFDVQMERINSYSLLHREQMLNGILELYDFVLGSLLGAEMTQKQSVIFRYVTRLLLHIPDATIHTMLALFQEGGTAKYRQHIEKLEGTARIFFEEEFDSREFTQTKRQVVRRLYGILENQAFNRMFSHPRSKLDLFSELNAGKVILINTAKDLLKETGTEIFGRFFIAMITQAAQERATIPAENRMPTFVYVDEAQDYFDDNIQIILSQARKYKVGMVMAHQYLDQLSPRLQSAFMANTSIKFAGGLSSKDARSFASEMQVMPDFILGQQRGSFAATMRGVTKRAMSLSFPFGHMEGMARHTSAEQERIRDAMRQRLAVPIGELYRREQDERRAAKQEDAKAVQPKPTAPKVKKPPPDDDPYDFDPTPTPELK